LITSLSQARFLLSLWEVLLLESFLLSFAPLLHGMDSNWITKHDLTKKEIFALQKKENFTPQKNAYLKIYGPSRNCWTDVCIHSTVSLLPDSRDVWAFGYFGVSFEIFHLKCQLCPIMREFFFTSWSSCVLSC
jgi:hypothetical protein